MKKKIEQNKKYILIAIFILALAGIVGIFVTKPLGKNFTDYKVAQFTSTGATLDLINNVANNLDKHAEVDLLEANQFRIYLPDTGRQNSEIQDQISNEIDLVSALTVNSIKPVVNQRLVSQIVFTLTVLIVFEVLYLIGAFGSFTRLSRLTLALSNSITFLMLIILGLGLNGLLATIGLYRIEPWSLIIVAAGAIAFYFMTFVTNLIFLSEAKSYKSENFSNEFRDQSKSTENFQIAAFTTLTLLGVTLFALTKTDFIYGTLLLATNLIVIIFTIKEIHPKIVEILMSRFNSYKPLVKSRFWQRN